MIKKTAAGKGQKGGLLGLGRKKRKRLIHKIVPQKSRTREDIDDPFAQGRLPRGVWGVSGVRSQYERGKGGGDLNAAVRVELTTTLQVAQSVIDEQNPPGKKGVPGGCRDKKKTT